MNQKQKSRNFSKLWLSPLLVGCLCATGYSITRKIQTFTSREATVFLNTFSIQKVFPGQSLDSFKKEQRHQKKGEFITKPSTEEHLEDLRKTNQPQNTNNAEKTTQKNPQNQNLQNSKVLDGNLYRSSDSLPLETQLFFKKHNIDEIIKKLPMP